METLRLRASPTMSSGGRGAAWVRHCLRPASTCRTASPSTPRPAPYPGVPHRSRSGCGLPRLCREGSLVAGVSGASPGPCPRGPGVSAAQSHPFSLAFARCMAAYPLSVLPGRAGHARTGRGRRQTRDCAGLSPGRPWEPSCVGGRWPCRARVRGLTQVRQGIATVRTNDAVLFVPY